MTLFANIAPTAKAENALQMCHGTALQSVVNTLRKKKSDRKESGRSLLSGL
jgi:hypothetical protein